MAFLSPKQFPDSPGRKYKPYDSVKASMDKMIAEKDAPKYSKGGTNHGNVSVEGNGSSSRSVNGVANYRPQG
jgi:hypothetical protein